MNLLALKIGVTGSKLCVTNSKSIFALDLNIIFLILCHTLCLDKGNMYAPGSVAKDSHLLLHSFCKYPQYFLFNPKFTIMSQLKIFMLHFSSHNTAFTYKSWLQTTVTRTLWQTSTSISAYKHRVLPPHHASRGQPIRRKWAFSSLESLCL